jgi:thioredoxin-like negative regulator of GroEL
VGDRQSSDARPRLVYFHSAVDGHCRRVEGFLAQVLQRRRNHETFKVLLVDQRERPDLFERFRVDAVPTLLLIENRAVRGRLEYPKSCVQIERFLAPWLRSGRDEDGDEDGDGAGTHEESSAELSSLPRSD